MGVEELITQIRKYVNILLDVHRNRKAYYERGRKEGGGGGGGAGDYVASATLSPPE